MSFKTVSRKTLIGVLWLIAHFSLMAQTTMSDLAVWNDLEAQIKYGNRRALRDLGTFLDKPRFADNTRRALAQATFFTKNELDITRCDRNAFISFLYENDGKLKYSEILGGFYITPIEFQPIDTSQILVRPLPVLAQNTPSVLLRNLTQKFSNLVQQGALNDSLVAVIKQIAELQSPDRSDWLRQTVRLQAFGRNKTEVNVALCEALATEPTEDNLATVILAIEKGYVPKDLLSAVFLTFTNYAVSLFQTRKMLDTFTSLEALRTFGYNANLPFNESFFYEKVDYYGKILSHNRAPHWLQRGAFYDMLLTQNPRLLFFLAAQIRLKPTEKAFYRQALEKLTFLTVDTEGGQLDGSRQTLGDRRSLEAIEADKNFVRWWAIHAEDFEWSEADLRFANRSEIAARTEELERLMRRLSSTNDSVAVAAFVALTEGEPTAVAATAEKFRPILLSYNRRLPDVSYPFLEQMTAFSSFCRQKGISLKLPNHADSLVKQLMRTTQPKMRYLIENQLLESLTLDDISALEFQGLLYSNDAAFNFSISRIVDIFYSNNWANVLSDHAQIRLYIKKAALFLKIGVSGVCSAYDKRLSRNDRKLPMQLEELAATESDGDIRIHIRKWLDTEGGQKMMPLTHDITRVDTTTIDLDVRLRELAQEATLTIEEINQLVNLPNFSIGYKPLVIKLLKRVYPLSSIKSFKLKNWFSAKTDLKKFVDFEILPKDLDDFVRIFNTDEPNAMWQFINGRTAEFTPIEKGNFWNALFKVSWFTDLIYSENISIEQRDTITKSLRGYIANNENLSEFEEQSTLLHIAELDNIGLKLHQKLDAALALDAPEAMKAAVQTAILARIRFDEIDIVAPYLNRLNQRADGSSPLSFLQTDFGIPIYSDDAETISELINNHKFMTAKQFYEFYLKKFGINVRTPEGYLDFNKIYDLLTFEVVAPFTGGGVQRDYVTYSVIKFLEFEFNTMLGFHEKLNENQTFYVYNAAKRAKAWRQFLRQKKVVKTNPSVSFND